MVSTYRIQIKASQIQTFRGLSGPMTYGVEVNFIPVEHPSGGALLSFSGAFQDVIDQIQLIMFDNQGTESMEAMSGMTSSLVDPKDLKLMVTIPDKRAANNVCAHAFCQDLIDQLKNIIWEPFRWPPSGPPELTEGHIPLDFTGLQ